MPRLQRSVAALRVSADDLIPEEITLLLGARPTTAYRKGEVLRVDGSRTRLAKFGYWSVSADDAEPEDFDAQVQQILASLTNDLAAWRELTQRYEVDLFCGWFMGGRNEGVEVSAATLLALGERGVVLGVDLYGPDRDA